ncbi:MAG: DUF1080 domain-containing protein [Sedimentisphaerales bacterium]|nr:DUF1080 domain-containing protein [Sedimentisphaerales bacterium]
MTIALACMSGALQAAPVCSCYFQEAQSAIEAADAAMGDWWGARTAAGGTTERLAAQVIVLGDDQYRANLLSRFDSREPLVAVLEGRRDGSTVHLAGQGWQGTIEDGRFTGTASGGDRFELNKVYRISPTLGLPAPPRAVILFDGSNMDQWEHVGQPQVGLIDLARLIGGDNQAAYLYGRVWSPRAQRARLELGSDDGIKVWLNEMLIHANDVARAAQPGQDQLDVQLRSGWNALLCKITNGGGDWAAYVRLVPADDRPLGLREARDRLDPADAGTDQGLKANQGYLTAWWVAGPYRQSAEDGASLFDAVFAPERDPAGVEWKPAGSRTPDPQAIRWILADGAMQVAGGGIISKPKFQDCRLHLEFCCPFQPQARGQGRGNSGLYHQGRYEVQILDSYSLEGRDNECGGIYQVASPRVNMCAPPLQWQTYDVLFFAARYDDQGQKTAPARLTVYHNDVLIHENQEIPGPTTGAVRGESPQPEGIHLQDHGNPVRFRNIWVLPLASTD